MNIRVSILTQYKALFIPNWKVQTAAGRDVSILTQYKALFIVSKICIKFEWVWVSQSLLNTRHCSSHASKYIGFFYNSVSILTQYKALFINYYDWIRRTCSRCCFNPYSIQGIVHLIKGHKVKKVMSMMFQSLLNTRHCSSKKIKIKKGGAR